MGGGMVFRGVTRLVGAATVGAAVVPTVGAHCHVRLPASNPSQEQENLLAILDDAQKEFSDENSDNKDCLKIRLEQGERAAEKGESSRGAALRQLVFYPPPTEEEVEEATEELREVLNLSIPAQGIVSEENLSDSMVGLTLSAGDTDIAAPLVPHKRDLSASSSSSQPPNFAVENSSVMQAFQRLQSNPKVQDVVKSLARDPAVWNAMLSNEKVLELTREDSHDSQDSYDYDDDDDFLKMKELGIRLASKFYDLTKVYYSYLRWKLYSILDSMFGSMEKTLATKSDNNKTLASCMMLAVAVVAVVVVRRSLRTS